VEMRVDVKEAGVRNETSRVHDHVTFTCSVLCSKDRSEPELETGVERDEAREQEGNERTHILNNVHIVLVWL